jgi:hypothetical protein
MLGGSGLAAVLGVVLFAFSGGLNATTVSAESPPNPPARFVGTVSIDGKPATPGTTVELHIGSATCGVTTVFASGAESRYTADSPALDPGAAPNCGTDNAVVTFMVGGHKANETGSWKNYQLNTVNLTVTTATTTATPSASATPKAPVAGSGVSSESSNSSVWLFAMLGLGALAFGVGGVATARKSGR